MKLELLKSRRKSDSPGDAVEHSVNSGGPENIVTRDVPGKIPPLSLRSTEIHHFNSMNSYLLERLRIQVSDIVRTSAIMLSIIFVCRRTFPSQRITS
jgi:hypothetical protein